VPAAAGSVFLPPSYASAIARRYRSGCPGYSVGAEQWSKEIHAPPDIEKRHRKERQGNDSVRSPGTTTPATARSPRCGTGLVLRSLIGAVSRQIADLILA